MLKHSPLAIPPEQSGGFGAWQDVTIALGAITAAGWITLLASSAWREDAIAWLILGPLTLACAALMARSRRSVREARRYGPAIFQLKAPAHAGAALEGAIELPPESGLTGLSARLVCQRVRLVQRQGGARRHPFRTVAEFWSSPETSLPVESTGAALRASIRFEIPAYLPGTSAATEAGTRDLMARHETFQWKIVLRATAPDAFRRTYAIRVYAAAPGAIDIPAMERPRLEAAREVARAEIASGKSPAVIALRLARLGIPDTAVAALIREFPPPHARMPLEAVITTRDGPVPAWSAAARLLLPWFRSEWALIAANVVPIGGVFFFGWDLFPIMLLFWFENVSVGFFNVLKILTCGNVGLGRVPLTAFFIFHYGMFCFVHGIFVVELFGRDALERLGLSHAFPGPGVFAALVAAYTLWPGMVALFTSHLYSYFSNFLIGGEYLRADARTLMAAPYTRVMVLHALIISGGFMFMAFQPPPEYLALLVVAKTTLDLYTHRRERRGFLQAAEPPEAGPTIHADESAVAALPVGRIGLSAAVIVGALVALGVAARH